MMRFAVVIEKANGNYSAYVPDLPGCVATGATVDEVRARFGRPPSFTLTASALRGWPYQIRPASPSTWSYERQPLGRKRLRAKPASASATVHRARHALIGHGRQQAEDAVRIREELHREANVCSRRCPDRDLACHAGRDVPAWSEHLCERSQESRARIRCRGRRDGVTAGLPPCGNDGRGLPGWPPRRIRVGGTEASAA